MSRNTKKIFHNKLKSGKEKTHSQTKKIRNKYLGGLSVVPQKDIGNCAAHAITRSIYRLCKKHGMKVPGTEEQIPDPPSNSNYFYDFALIQLVLNKFNVTVGHTHYENNILYILKDISSGSMMGGGNKTKDKIETIRKHIDNINETIHEISKNLEPINDGTVKNIEEVKKLSDEINKLRSEKNDHIQNLNDLIYQDKIKKLDVINIDGLRKYEEDDNEYEQHDTNKDEPIEDDTIEDDTIEDVTNEDDTKKDDTIEDVTNEGVTKKDDTKKDDTKKVVTNDDVTNKDVTKKDVTKKHDGQDQKSDNKNNTNARVKKANDDKIRKLPSSTDILHEIITKFNNGNYETKNKIAEALRQIDDASNDFEKAKILLEDIYLSNNEKITISNQTFNEYADIDRKQRLVYFTILPMITYIEYMVVNRYRYERSMIECLNLQQQNMINTIVNVIMNSDNKRKKEEYYIGFNQYLDSHSPIKYPSYKANKPKDEVQQITLRVTKQYNDYKQFLQQFNNKKIHFGAYTLDKYINTQTNTEPIYGMLGVPTNYMDKFPESKHAEEHSHGHAVSITSINYKANATEGVIVKYKNSWLVMFGEKGHQTMELNKSDFSESLRDYNNKITIFGITLQ